MSVDCVLSFPERDGKYAIRDLLQTCTKSRIGLLSLVEVYGFNSLLYCSMPFYTFDALDDSIDQTCGQRIRQQQARVDMRILAKTAEQAH